MRRRPPRTQDGKRFTPFPTSEEVGQRIDLHRGPGRDSPEAIALERWAGPLGICPEGESYGTWARRQCDFSPAAWSRAILERKVIGPARRPSLALLTKIIADWRAMDRPEWDLRMQASAGDPPSGAAPPATVSPAESRRLAFKAALGALRPMREEAADARP